MKLRVRQIEIPVGYKEKDVIEAIAAKLRCDSREVIKYELIRRSLDARPRHIVPIFILQADVLVKKSCRPIMGRDVEEAPPIATVSEESLPRFKQDRKSPIVIGAGPAGLMAALHLSVMGLKPILLERGSDADTRKDEVTAFWRAGALNKESNVLFGEGGAGLFSDGKLTARSKDKPRMRLFFETLVQCGAPKDILIDAEPHLGSDLLIKIVPKIRKLIEANGGKIQFNTPMTDLMIENGRVVGVKSGFSEYFTDTVLLATGHSARDVYHLLAESDVELQKKPFAIGVRIEMPQLLINRAQLGKFSMHKALGAASFRLTRKPEENARACYSFCPCPGGLVITCANEEGTLTTNGMSYSQREGIWGNAAFLVPVTPEDFEGTEGSETHPELAGLNFQHKIEKAVYKLGGNGFRVPALRLSDFLKGRVSKSLPENRSCRRTQASSFDEILPAFVIETLKQALPHMLKQLKIDKYEDVVMYAAETRSSSPVRILRDENSQATKTIGLFPAGEGSGYAGGIVSSAIDGLKAAEHLMDTLKI